MKRLFIISLLVFILHSIDVQAANWYVRPIGGSGSGTSWTTAWNGLNAINWGSVSCGDTIWIAGGTYTQSLNPSKNCTSGAQLYIRRARSDALACTSASGWSSGFDSLILHQISVAGRAAINFGTTNSSYITISGRTTAPGGDYGWKIYRPNTYYGMGVEFANSTVTTNITLEYMEIEGPTDPQNATDDLRGIDITPLTGGHNSYSLFSHLKIHGWSTGIYDVSSDHNVHEYLDMYNIRGNSIEHANLFYINNSHYGTIRYSKFHDAGASGTGIAFSDLDVGAANYWQIYGNIFNDNTQTSVAAAIGIQDAPVLGLKIFNNTFSNNGMNINISGNGACSSGSETKNNIFHGAGGSINCGTTSNNLVTSNDSIFVNRASDDFHIVSSIGSGYPRNAATVLSTYFKTDMGGTTFGGDGSWDVGAFEVGFTYSDQPSAPSNLSVN